MTTSLDTPELDLVGFRYAADGRRVVDTSFLDEDPSGAAALLRDVFTPAGQVETAGDTGGRHQGSSGRWWARAKRAPAESPGPRDRS